MHTIALCVLTTQHHQRRRRRTEHACADDMHAQYRARIRASRLTRTSKNVTFTMFHKLKPQSRARHATPNHRKNGKHIYTYYIVVYILYMPSVCPYVYVSVRSCVGSMDDVGGCGGGGGVDGTTLRHAHRGFHL